MSRLAIQLNLMKLIDNWAHLHYDSMLLLKLTPPLSPTPTANASMIDTPGTDAISFEIHSFVLARV